MAQRVEVELDDQGRIGLSLTVRDRLGLTAGMTLVVEQEAADVTYLRVRDESPRLVDKGGVLVIEGRPAGEVGDLAREDRDERIASLLSRGIAP